MREGARWPLGVGGQGAQREGSRQQGAAGTKALRQEGGEYSRNPLWLEGRVLGDRSDYAVLEGQGGDFGFYFEGAT